MTEWIRLATEVRDLKGRILPGNITKDITQYNDNLERAKKERILQKFKQCCSNFNNAHHVKEEGYYEYVDWYDWDGTYWYQYVWHEPVYWEITGYEGYNYQSLGSLAMLIENMERQSGISFMDPKDWQQKLKLNGRDDAAFKYM